MKYADVSCSQCGRSFGPGDHGFSHCEDHPGHVADMKAWKEELLRLAAEIEGQAEEIDPYRDDPELLVQFIRPHVNELRQILTEMRRGRR